MQDQESPSMIRRWAWHSTAHRWRIQRKWQRVRSLRKPRVPWQKEKERRTDGFASSLRLKNERSWAEVGCPIRPTQATRESADRERERKETEKRKIRTLEEQAKRLADMKFHQSKDLSDRRISRTWQTLPSLPPLSPLFCFVLSAVDWLKTKPGRRDRIQKNVFWEPASRTKGSRRKLC